MKPATDVTVTIVGGGPVGLFLACSLTRIGIDCVVLEKREAISSHSRAIGIHPCALACLNEIGIAESLIARGVQIQRARGYFGSRSIGRMDFRRVLASPFGFVLAVPQAITEATLSDRLVTLAPHALCRGVSYERHEEEAEGLVIHGRRADRPFLLRTRYLIGCDGARSLVRQNAQIPVVSSPYPDRYWMGDFADTTDFANEAVLFLSPQGIVESFPLPGKLRRWVAHRGNREGQDATAEALTATIRLRTGVKVAPETCRMLSAFGVHQQMAERFVQNRVILVGDAAHVCSPMGGQGMNCGILGADRLTLALQHLPLPSVLQESRLLSFEADYKRMALTVANRANLNTLLGRGGISASLIAATMSGLLHIGPAHDRLARQFTMQGI